MIKKMVDKKLENYYVFIYQFQVQLDIIRQSIKYCKYGQPPYIFIGDKKVQLKKEGLNILELMEKETMDILKVRRKWFNKKYHEGNNI